MNMCNFLGISQDHGICDAFLRLKRWAIVVGPSGTGPQSCIGIDTTARTLLNAYNQIGARNSRWDNPARDALDAFARLRCETDTNSGPRLKASLERVACGGLH